jgi:hypothetical protein
VRSPPHSVSKPPSSRISLWLANSQLCCKQPEKNSRSCDLARPCVRATFTQALSTRWHSRRRQVASFGRFMGHAAIGVCPRNPDRHRFMCPCSTGFQGRSPWSYLDAGRVRFVDAPRLVLCDAAGLIGCRPARRPRRWGGRQRYLPPGGTAKFSAANPDDLSEPIVRRQEGQ